MELAFLILQSYLLYVFYETPMRMLLRKIWECSEKKISKSDNFTVKSKSDKYIEASTEDSIKGKNFEEKSIVLNENIKVDMNMKIETFDNSMKNTSILVQINEESEMIKTSDINEKYVELQEEKDKPMIDL